MTALSIPAIRAIASRFAPYVAMALDRMSPEELAQLDSGKVARDLAETFASLPGPMITVVCATDGAPPIEEVREWHLLPLMLRFAAIINATVKEHGSDEILAIIFQAAEPYSLKANRDRAVISLEVRHHRPGEIVATQRGRPGEIVSGSTVTLPENSK